MKPVTREQAARAHEASMLYDNQRLAAASLGIALSTFQNRLKRAAEYEIGTETDDSSYAEGALHSDSVDAGMGFPIDDVAHYWVKTDKGSYFVRRPGAASYADMRDEIIEQMEAHAPDYDVDIAYVQGDHLLVINVADLHIGKLCVAGETGFDYDIPTAVARMRKGVERLVAKASLFGVKQYLVVLGNDIIHIDHAHRHTTSGTPQDTSGQWWQMFNAAKSAYVELIERLAVDAPVHVIHNPSNHDFHAGWFLADSVASWFTKHPNVSFGEKNRGILPTHRKYIEFGHNLLGFTHGDGAKESDLPAIIANEAREAWGRCQFVYWYTAHLHHKKRSARGPAGVQQMEKDRIGVTVLHTAASTPSDNVFLETLRSPSPPDRWHSTNGYLNMQAVEVFLHHAEGGQVARFTEFF